MLNGDGTPWIHSFAHGRTIYHLRYDAAAVRAALRRTQDANILNVLVRLDAQAEINEVELEKLVRYVSNRTGDGIRAITRTVQRRGNNGAPGRRRNGVNGAWPTVRIRARNSPARHLTRRGYR